MIYKKPMKRRRINFFLDSFQCADYVSKMGNCFKGKKNTSGGGNIVDPEERRRQAAQAAEARHKQSAGRGLKDPDAYYRKGEQREKLEKESANAGGGSNLKWRM